MAKIEGAPRDDKSAHAEFADKRGDVLFKIRLGFSGTPSDLLPVELGKCAYEKGSDAKMLTFLTTPSVTSYHRTGEWSIPGLLDMIA
ncbi:MAG: hypothetical protein CMJ46_00585, partial [Planctomyces sp.]|nr:hypothetical protein [Planctomyces sp.]